MIYPIIEESEKLDLKAAKEMFRQFQTKEFKDLTVGLIHGQMKQKDSREVMGRFKNKEIDILVATTVVEVGVDVPEATVIIIESAQRFGLSQLHQLRGRVGRGERQAWCILMADEGLGEDARRRLEGRRRAHQRRLRPARCPGCTR